MDTKFHGLSLGGSGSIGADTYADPQPMQPALSSVCSTMDEAVRLAQRVSSVVDRLCGSVPTPVGQTMGKDHGGYSSIFDGLRGQADNANRQIQDAMDALNRLDRELP